MSGKLSQAQLRLMEWASSEWVMRLYGASQFRTADSLVRRDLGEFAEGQDRYGRANATGFRLTAAGVEALRAALTQAEG